MGDAQSYQLSPETESEGSDSAAKWVAVTVFSCCALPFNILLSRFGFQPSKSGDSSGISVLSLYTVICLEPGRFLSFASPSIANSKSRCNPGAKFDWTSRMAACWNGFEWKAPTLPTEARCLPKSHGAVALLTGFFLLRPHWSLRGACALSSHQLQGEGSGSPSRICRKWKGEARDLCMMSQHEVSLQALLCSGLRFETEKRTFSSYCA